MRGVKVNRMLKMFQRNERHNDDVNIKDSNTREHQINRNDGNISVSSDRKKIVVAKYPCKNDEVEGPAEVTDCSNNLEDRNPESDNKVSPQEKEISFSKRFIISSPELRDDELRERIERQKIERLHAIRLKQKHDKAESMHQHRTMKERKRDKKGDRPSSSVNTLIDELNPSVADPKFSVRPAIPEHKRSVEETPHGSPNGKKIRTSEYEKYPPIKKQLTKDPVRNTNDATPSPNLSRWIKIIGAPIIIGTAVIVAMKLLLKKN